MTAAAGCTGGLLTAEPTGGSSGTTLPGAGGAAAHCGGTSVLTDDFPGTDPGEVWVQTTTNGASVAETGGEAVVTLPSGVASGTRGSFQTLRYYDLRGDTVSVKVTGVTDPATTAATFLSVVFDSNDFLRIEQRQGALRFVKVIGGTRTEIASVPYSAAKQSFWRFREDGKVVHWETSSDGFSWVSQAEEPTTSLFPLDTVRVEIGASTDGGEVSPGEAHFNVVNGGGKARGKWCRISSIRDSFGGGVMSRVWNRAFTNAPMTVAQMGGDLVMTLAPNAKVYSAYVSAASFDLTGDAVVLNVLGTASIKTSAQTYLMLGAPGDNGIQIMEQEGQLMFSMNVNGMGKPVGQLPYDPAQHAWWRIREASGTIFLETASDGKTWVVQAQTPKPPFAIDTLDVILGSGTWKDEPNPGVAQFDNVNLPPP